MDRSEILANFQACTGIDDFNECIARLEATEWNLEEAVSGVLSQDVPPNMQGVEITNSISTNSPFEMSEEAAAFSRAPNPFSAGETLAQESPGGTSTRMIMFVLNLNGETKTIELDDTATLDVLNDVAAIELGVPRSSLEYDGWPNNAIPNSPTQVFTTLRLPGRVELKVNVYADNNIIDLTKSYTLKIHDVKHNKMVEMQLQGSQSVAEIKTEAAKRTKIAESRQVWTGLNVSDTQCTVASLHLDQPVHCCSIRSTPSIVNLPDEDGSSSDIEFVDASEDNSLYYLDDSTVGTSRKPLMPEHANDDVAATTQFCEEFRSRFGDCPLFYVGSLEDASQAAFSGPAVDRKLLAIYLHHEKSIQSNVFCSEVLCKPMVLDYLSTNVVVWGWDVTTEFNRARFLTIGKRILGKATADMIERIRRDEFPAFIIVEGRGRSAKITSSISQGHDSLDVLMSKLINAWESTKAQQTEDIAMERESQAREQVKREQEDAYQQSLMQDMEKQRRQNEEKEEQSRIDQAIRLEEESRQLRITQLQSCLPPEPSDETTEEVSTLQFRPPDGSGAFKRRFLAKEKLVTVLKFIESKGFTRDRYRLLSAWPKRDITSLDESLTLKEHKLFPKDSLIIEEIN